MSASHKPSSPVAVLKDKLRSLQADATRLRAELSRVTDELDRYEQAIAILERGVSVRQETPSDQVMPNERIPFRPSSESGVTQLASAEKALRAAGRPLPISELLARMIAVDFPGQDPKKLRGSVVRTLDRRVDKEKMLKPEPGVYALPSAHANGTANLEG